MKKFYTAAAAIFIITLLLSLASPSYAFTSAESRTVKSFFIDAGLLKGDGTDYGLKNPATRLEGIIILTRLMGKEAEALEMKDLPCRFTDVPDWARGYVNYAYEQNLSKGIRETVFGCNENMTALQYNTWMLRLMGYNDTEGDFQWDNSIEKASELSILPPNFSMLLTLQDVFTKGDLIDSSFLYLEASFKDEGTKLIDMLTETGVISYGLAEDYGLKTEGWDDIKTGFDEEGYLEFTIDGNRLNVTGAGDGPDKRYLLVNIADKIKDSDRINKTGKIGSDGQYDISLSLENIPDGEYYADVYGNDEKYGTYNSIILSRVLLKKSKDDIYFEPSPVYGQNLRSFMGIQMVDDDLRMNTLTRVSEDASAEIAALAEEITSGISDDYEKVRAIHDWVADKIYYDKDYLNKVTDETNIRSIDVLRNRYAVCSGYSNLTEDLLTAAGIPNKQVIGYSLGYEGVDSWDAVDWKNETSNHVWNAAYVDRRWVILDTTWDSDNSYENGKFSEGKGPNRTYFDVSLPFLSNTHMITIL